MKVAGKYLWSVNVSYRGFISRSTVSLNILTRAHSSVECGRRSLAFLHKQRNEYPASRVEGMSYKGTIDQ